MTKTKIQYELATFLDINVIKKKHDAKNSTATVQNSCAGPRATVKKQLLELTDSRSEIVARLHNLTKHCR